MTPEKITNITKYVVGLFLDSRREQAIPPPVIIKGGRGTGKSWILNSVFKELKEKQSVTGLIPVRVPLHLNATFLLQSIQREMDLSKIKFLDAVSDAGIAKRTRFLLFIDEIDALFNTDVREKMPARAFGRGASQFSQIQHAAQLRSFLIENNEKVSLLTTSNQDIRFTEDPEQPFYNFFNLLELSPLDSAQSSTYFFDRLKSTNDSLGLTRVIRGFNPDWIQNLTDGKILHIHFLVDVFKKIELEDLGTPKSLEDVLETILTTYFLKLTPYYELELSKLSYQEKLLVDLISLLHDGFTSREVQGFDSNISLVTTKLKDKLFLNVEGEGHAAKYYFASTSLKAFLRFFKKTNMLSVISPKKVAVRA